MTDYGNVAGALILQARLLADLTQQELAGVAGLSQPDVSAYETGRRQPTLPMLYRLLAATGLEPRIRLEPLDRHDDVVRAWHQTRPQDEQDKWERQQAAFLASS